SAQYIRAGKLKAIAAGSPRRLPQLPDVPTLIESGLENADVDMWYGLFAPKSTPGDIVARLNRDVATVLRAPDTKAVFEAQGLVPAVSSPAELGEIVARGKTRWAEGGAQGGISTE